MAETGEVGRIARHLTDDHARLDALARADRDARHRGARGVRRIPRRAPQAHRPRGEDLGPRCGERGGEDAPRVPPAPDRARRARVAAVPTPTPELVAEIESILVPHDAREEGPGGVCDECDRLLGSDHGGARRALAYPPVRVAPYSDGRACSAPQRTRSAVGAGHGGALKDDPAHEGGRRVPRQRQGAGRRPRADQLVNELAERRDLPRHVLRSRRHDVQGARDALVTRQDPHEPARDDVGLRHERR